MASTSACSTQRWNYDVFLCFRGVDTRKNFVSHLLAALHQPGIIAYIDRETLPRGEPILSVLFNTIENSRIAVIVFSKRFTDSKFCLDELAHIMYCKDRLGQIVIPIFYHVKPSDVRKQKGEFDIHKRIYDMKKVELWRNALVNASSLHGWIIGDIPERVYIKEVVDTISNKLSPKENQAEIGNPVQDQELRSHDSTLDHSKQINTSMTSSFSNSHPSKLANHDVFLSFHEDIRFTFVDHLYSALDQHKILTYMYMGRNIFDPSDSLLFKAIEESKIFIIILSKNYASSSRCLDELRYIMEKWMSDTKSRVIPLYYDVDPSEVRNQRSEYREAFSKHESINSLEAELWRKALKDLSHNYGWEIGQIADGYEAKGIQLIVKKISNILFPDIGLIGLQTRLGDMKYVPSVSDEDFKHLSIPLQEIELATNYFSEKNSVARGGFGKVYRGLSNLHGTIAVKRLDRRFKQGDNQFMMEIALLSAFKHENLVSLVGYCDQDGEKILVLKYEKNGSLDKHLLGKDLTWIKRLEICLDAANGLKYLHEEVGPQYRIIHRDVKSSNILLDENWKAKISDFGLSKIAPALQCSVIKSDACGTLGYVDPQYQNHNILTQKSDVYSFGVVLFEVLCSRLVNVRNFSAKLAQDHYEKETLDEIIDLDLRSQMNSDCLSMYSTIAYQCLKKRTERPTMGLVVDQLEKALDYQQGSSGSWHDVYICFRHKDSECHIVDDIRGALHQEEVSTYKDNVTLSRKETTLLKAIKRSRFFVIIFTKKFAVNSWHLDEVANIVECMQEKGQFVLPVFHSVSRSDVRTQKGYFGEVMSEYDTHPRIDVWKNALLEATNPLGLEYSRFRSSVEFVRKIVDEIKIGLSAQENQSLPE